MDQSKGRYSVHRLFEVLCLQNHPAHSKCQLTRYLKKISPECRREHTNNTVPLTGCSHSQVLAWSDFMRRPKIYGRTVERWREIRSSETDDGTIWENKCASAQGHLQSSGSSSLPTSRLPIRNEMESAAPDGEIPSRSKSGRPRSCTVVKIPADCDLNCAHFRCFFLLLQFCEFVSCDRRKSHAISDGQQAHWRTILTKHAKGSSSQQPPPTWCREWIYSCLVASNSHTSR